MHCWHGRGFSRCKEHSPHAWLGSIHRANHGRVVRHNLCKMSRMVGNAVGKSFKICQVGLKVGGDPHAVLVSMRKSQLECPKETKGPWDCGSHESKFSEQLLPFLDANSPFVVEVLNPKRPKAPGTAGPMNRSSPSSCCHFLMPTRPFLVEVLKYGKKCDFFVGQ